jgi:hypothetical protein
MTLSQLHLRLETLIIIYNSDMVKVLTIYNLSNSMNISGLL